MFAPEDLGGGQNMGGTLAPEAQACGSVANLAVNECLGAAS